MIIPEANRATALDMLGLVDASPSPWHAVAEMRHRLEAAGFRQLDESAPWNLKPGDACLITRGGSSLGAFVVGHAPPADAGFRVVGAHTDSPCLKVKPAGIHEKQGVIRVGVEIYGGPILATWTDRELSLAGRVVLRDGHSATRVRTHLVKVDRPLLRLPNAAIHLNREVNNKGLVLDKQEELPLLLAAAEELDSGARLLELLCRDAGVDAADLLDFDLCACDTQPSALFGLDEEFLAAPRLDNLAMCHAAMTALIRHLQSGEVPAQTAVAILFDNEEVGSQSAQGADGSLLPDLLERIGAALDPGREAFLRACSSSFLVSADMAHAFHPNHARLLEPQHLVRLNGGPVIKQNANLRYTTDGLSAARFKRHCEQAGVPVQRYVHRNDLPCGTTIGPMASSRLGIVAVDVGNPMLSMHSIRESAGVMDPEWMSAALHSVFGSVE